MPKPKKMGKLKYIFMIDSFWMVWYYKTTTVVWREVD